MALEPPYRVAASSLFTRGLRITDLVLRVIAAAPPITLRGASSRINAWLDGNCGADGWAITPASRAVVNDAIAVYLRDATFPAAFVAR